MVDRLPDTKEAAGGSRWYSLYTNEVRDLEFVLLPLSECVLYTDHLVIYKPVTQLKSLGILTYMYSKLLRLDHNKSDMQHGQKDFRPYI